MSFIPETLIHELCVNHASARRELNNQLKSTRGTDGVFRSPVLGEEGGVNASAKGKPNEETKRRRSVRLQLRPRGQARYDPQVELSFRRNVSLLCGPRVMVSPAVSASNVAFVA